MRLVILTGSGEVLKRAEKLKIQKSFPKDLVSFLDFKQTDFEQIQTAINSPPLLNFGPRLVVIENLTDKIDLSKLQSSDPNLTILIIGNFNSQFLSQAKLHEVLTFNEEQEVPIFPFLDSLIEGKKAAYESFEILKQMGGMYLLTMIYYSLRRNFLPTKSALLRSKISRQKKGLDFKHLYHRALEVEYQIKSGVTTEFNGLSKLVRHFLT